MIACAVVPLTHQHLAFPRDSVQWRFSVRAGAALARSAHIKPLIYLLI